MAIKTLKKTLVYTSETSKNLIENMVSDEAEVTKMTASAVMENYILYGLLPKNKNIRYWIQCLYCGNWKINDVLAAIYGYNSAGLNWKSVGLNLLPLIKFDSIRTTQTRKSKIDENILPHLCDSLEWMIKTTKKGSEKDNEYNDISLSLQRIIDDIHENPKNIIISDFYRLVITFWESLKDSTFTFRALTDFVSLQVETEDTSFNRFELICLLRDLDKEWPDE